MTYFYQYKNQDNFNKIYGDGPFPSGAGAIPYTFGWGNKLAPKPFGMRIIPEELSNLANPNSTLGAQTEGPVNAIYEIEVSGIANKSGFGCRLCENLNRKYIVYHNTNTNDTAAGDGLGSHGSLSWFGRTCDAQHPINICNIDGIYLNLTTGRPSNFKLANNVGDTTASGTVYLVVAMQYGTVDDINTADVLHEGGPSFYFVKNFGNVEFANTTHNSRKPHMMDGEHILLPSGNDNMTIYGNATQAFCVGTETTAQTAFSSGDYDCDLTNASVTVRPYKASMFDIKNSSFLFYSGDYFPLFGPGFEGINTDRTFEGFGASRDTNVTYRDDYNAFLGICNNYYKKNVPNYDHLIRNSGAAGTSFNNYLGDSGVHSVYNFAPYLFSLRFSGVTNNSGQLPNCIGCDDFYGFSRNLLINPMYSNLDTRDGLLPNQAEYTRYQWRAHTFADNTSDYNYFNICDFGCGSPNRVLEKNNGPCNNFIELVLHESGITYPESLLFKRKLTAYLYFGSFSNYNPSASGTIAKKHFKKTICDDNNPNNLCTLSGVVGIHDCFLPNIWNGGWILEDTDISHGSVLDRFILESGLDVTNYCNFTNTTPVLTPQSNPTTPCAAQLCTICDGYKVPRTITATFNTTVWYNVCSSGAWGSDTVVMELQKNRTVDTIDRSYNGKRGCIWTYDDGITSASCRYFGVSSGNWNKFLLSYGTTTGSISAGGSACASGLNTGGIIDFHLNCANGLIDTNNGATCSGNVTVTVTDIEFGDIYDIRDYL